MGDNNQNNPLEQFIAEAKRRHVFRTAGLYAGAAFVVLQMADIVMPALHLGETAITYLLIIIAAGFPLALIAAWVLDISGEGLTITERLSSAERQKLTGPRLVDGIIVVLALAVGFMYFERFMNEESEPAAQAPMAEVNPAAEPPPIKQAALEPSIAVLPFENLSTSEENEYFAAGIHEDILNNLSKLGELIVTSRTSTLAYAGSAKPIPQIAEELGVNYVIEGSVRRAGERVRISVQLIEAGSDSHIWSEGYERAIIDVFKIQQQIANEVSHALRVQFDIDLEAGEYPTRSLEAYQLFLESRALANTYDPDNVAKAIDGYRRALEIDPDYADAWAGLALALNSTLLFGQADREIEESRVAADKALELTPDSWMANFAKAMIIGGNGTGFAAQSLPYFEKAMAINPNDGTLLAQYGFNLWFAGDARSAMEQFLAAYRRNPLAADANMARAMVAGFEGDHITSEKFLRRGLDIAPNSSYINWWAGAGLANMNNIEGAVQQFGNVLALNPDHLGATFWLASMLTTLGDYETADYWLDRAEAIAPNNPQYLVRRANNFALGGKAEDYQALIDHWVKIDPASRDAQRYQAFATARAVRQAWDREDMQAFKTLNRKAIDESLAYLEGDRSSSGEYRVNFTNSWSFLAAAMHASNLGEQATVTELTDELINFHESQPPGSFSSRDLQMMIAYALRGKRQQAITHARKMTEQDYSMVWIVEADSYGMRNDPYGIYNGVNEDIAFQNVIAQMEGKNVAILDRLRQSVPAIFPPEA